MGGFAESEIQSLVLEDECVRVFRMFLHWMYTRRIKVPSRPWSPTSQWSSGPEDSKEDSPAPPEESQESEGQAWTQRNLIDLYIFADKRSVPELRNDVITKLIKRGEESQENGTSSPLSTIMFASHTSVCHEIQPLIDTWSLKQPHSGARRSSPMPTSIHFPPNSWPAF